MFTPIDYTPPTGPRGGNNSGECTADGCPIPNNATEETGWPDHPPGLPPDPATEAATGVDTASAWWQSPVSYFFFGIVALLALAIYHQVSKK